MSTITRVSEQDFELYASEFEGVKKREFLLHDIAVSLRLLVSMLENGEANVTSSDDGHVSGAVDDVYKLLNKNVPHKGINKA